MVQIDYQDCVESIEEVVVNPEDVMGFGPQPEIMEGLTTITF